MIEPSVDCLLLAAGTSSRMGEWKMVLPWEDATILECSLRRALEVCRRVIVVTGHRAADVQRLLLPLEAAGSGAGRVVRVHNPGYERGMFSSVQAGTALVETGRFFLALGDMPRVEAGTWRRLLACADEHPRVPALIPKYRGKKGHPLLLTRPVASRILELDPGLSMREVLAGFPTLAVPVEDPGVLLDIDDDQDYRKHRP